MPSAEARRTLDPSRDEKPGFRSSWFWNSGTTSTTSGRFRIQKIGWRELGLVPALFHSSFLRLSASLILLDYTLFVWHILTHKIPLLWKFHEIHHRDLDLTVSSSFRFHFGELFLSIPYRIAQILVIGVSAQAFLIWQSLLMVEIAFHHSNIKLPLSFERILSFVLVTPRMHEIHHSIRKFERDSNWSSGLAVWDILHRTRRSISVEADASGDADGDVLIGSCEEAANEHWRVDLKALLLLKK